MVAVFKPLGLVNTLYQFFFCPSGKPLVKHLPEYHKVYDENTKGCCDETYNRERGYFGVVREKVTWYLIEHFLKYQICTPLDVCVLTRTQDQGWS